MPARLSTALGAAYNRVFDLPATPVRNPRDPDQAFHDAVNGARGAALTFGIQGNVVGQGAVVAQTMALRSYWLGLQLNPFTSSFFDGKVQKP